MKPYLVDLPVSIQAFVRPDLLKKQWEVIKKARPSILFIRSDGPRENFSSDAEKIMQSRGITRDIDWDCRVFRLYSKRNQGMYATIKRGDDFVWKFVDRCLFLEDDLIPAVSTFRFCAELLEKYKNDLRIGRIVLSLWGEKHETGDGDYFFAKSAAAGGTAMWRRSAEFRNRLTCYATNEYAMNAVKTTIPGYLRKQFYDYSKYGSYDGHAPAFEFNNRFNEYFYSQLNIIPCRPLISNHGIGDGSTHSGKTIKTLARRSRKLYFIETHEIAFPIKHPQFVIEDKAYIKLEKKYLGSSNLVAKFFRKAERLFLLLIHGDLRRIKNAVRRKKGKMLEK